MRQKLTYLIHRDGAYCHYCCVSFRSKDSTYRATVDHVVPKKKGGTNELTNLVAACSRCNNAKGELDYDEFVRIVKYRGWRFQPTEFKTPKPPKRMRESEALPSYVLRVGRDDKRW